MTASPLDVFETVTIPIDENNLPEGPHWDDEGACYVAEKCDPDAFGCTWYWTARNLKAFAKGYGGQKLYPFILPLLNASKLAGGG